jgi:Domain of unknown function (DUF4166)
MASQSLYRRVLGDRFNALPEVLKRFHGASGNSDARGTFRVKRGSGYLRNLVATILGMPRAGENVPVHLEVVVKEDREIWLRHFPGQTLKSVQCARGNLLMERFGLGSFACALELHGSRLVYVFKQSWFLGVPVPQGLAPFVDSYVEAGETGWLVVVRIFAPLLGEIVHYEGQVEPEF